MNDVKQILEKLKKSPLFYLFISSRELFHSNFWMWLATLNKHEAAKLFVPEMASGADIEFKREHNAKDGEHSSKIDLVIYSNSNICAIVENKIKDYPTKAQLDRIRLSLGNLKKPHVLVSLFSPAPDCDWHVVTYKTLAERISPSVFSDNSYHQALIDDYRSFIRHLAELATLLAPTDKYDFAISHSKELFGLLNGSIWETYQKMRGSHFIAEYVRGFNTLTLSPSYHIYHQKATLHFPIELPHGYRIGIQIEDDQFRKFVSGKSPEKFAIALLEKNLFFSDDRNKRSNKAVFNKYEPDFRYQYIKISPGTTQISVFKTINDDLEYLNDNIQSIIALIPK